MILDIFISRGVEHMSLPANTKNAHPVPFDLPGAPFRIGEAVIVVIASDETFDSRCLGMRGTVDYLEYSCGCGQTYPGDPMIGVKLTDGTLEEFWQEELIRA